MAPPEGQDMWKHTLKAELGRNLDFWGGGAYRHLTKPDNCRNLYVCVGGCTHNLACHSHTTIDLASLQSRNGARRLFAGPGSVMPTFAQFTCVPFLPPC